MNGHGKLRMNGLKFDEIKVVGWKLTDDDWLKAKHVMVSHRRNEYTCEATDADGNCTWETGK